MKNTGMDPHERHMMKLSRDANALKANQFYEAEAAKRAALQAAGGLASDKTLRDEFAEDALHGVIITCGRDTRLINETTPEMFARKAYEIADAMLEARKTPKGDV
jgi:hypothetical protein